MILVSDDVLPAPLTYRENALRQEFKSVETGPGVVFHGIATDVPPTVSAWLCGQFPGLRPKLSFFRKSPEGQLEPNFIHTDRDMGDWTAILYLNPKPPDGDGTTFYEHEGARGRHSTAATHDDMTAEWLEWRDTGKWHPWFHVGAKFNRLVLFESSLFHARSIRDNYGAGDQARLIQLTFGTGTF